MKTKIRIENKRFLIFDCFTMNLVDIVFHKLIADLMVTNNNYFCIEETLTQ